MTVFDRVVVGIDGTDFGFEALHQTLALVPPGASVLGVTALDMAGIGRAGFEMEHYRAQFSEDADRAREKATEILGDRPNCTTKVVQGSAKSVLRHVCSEHDATLIALGGRSSSGRSVLFARPQWGPVPGNDGGRDGIRSAPRFRSVSAVRATAMGASMASEAGSGRVGRIRALDRGADRR